MWVWPPNGFKTDFAKSLSTCPCFPGFVVALQPVSNLAQGQIWNHFVSSGFKLLWSQIIVTKQKQNIRLICYMVTHYWGLMCMWYKNKLFNIIWYQYPTHQSPISTIWQMPSHMAWQLAASLGSTSDICVVSYIFRKIHGEHLRLRVTCVTLSSTLVFNDAAFPVEMQ